MKRAIPLATFVVAATSAAIAAPVSPVKYTPSQIESALTLRIGQGRTVRLSAAADSVVVARPEVADVQVPSPGQIFVFGKGPGRTTVSAFGKGGALLATIDVAVAADATAVNAAVGAMPGAAAGASAVDGIVRLEGVVASPAQAAAATALARQAAGKPDLVAGDLRVQMPTQVNLRVRIAEVSRTLTRELGFNWESLVGLGGSQILFGIGRDLIASGTQPSRSPTGADNIGFQLQSGSTDLNGVVDALAQDGLVTVLAEPNLTARSGETASFLSGGEFPIPIDNRDRTVTVEFKKFGVSLDFTPTVLDDGRISLTVRPEVSELNQNAGIEIGGLRIPGLSVRRAETTVELGSGQSFAIAGLVQSNSSNNVRAFPGLSDIPILGALFRSTRFQRQETELVIMVTPYLVRPVSSPARLATPIDTIDPAVDFKSLVMGRLTRPGNTPLPRPADDVGFILE